MQKFWSKYSILFWFWFQNSDCFGIPKISPKISPKIPVNFDTFYLKKATKLVHISIFWTSLLEYLDLFLKFWNWPLRKCNVDQHFWYITEITKWPAFLDFSKSFKSFGCFGFVFFKSFGFWKLRKFSKHIALLNTSQVLNTLTTN